MLDDRDPRGGTPEGPGMGPRSAAAGGRMRTGRTCIARYPSALGLAALATAAVAAFSCLDTTEPRSSPRGVLQLPGHNLVVKAVAFSPDGGMLASGGADQTVRLWETAGWADGHAGAIDVLNHPSWVYAAAFSPDGSLLAAAGNGFTTLWTCRPARQKRAEWVCGLILAGAFAPDGRTLALGREDGTVGLREVPAGTERRALRGPPRGAVMALAFSPDGTLLAVASLRGRLALWDVERGAERRVLVDGGSHAISAVAFAPDGRSIAAIEVGHQPQDVLIFDAETGALRARRADQPLSVALAFAPGGRALAVGGAYDTIRLLHPETAVPVGALAGQATWSQALAFSPDGRWLAHAAGYDDLRVLDLSDPSSWRIRPPPDRQPSRR